MIDRESVLLLLVERNRETWGKTRVQKLIFLVETNVVQQPPAPFQYHFYKHGPFSIDVAFTLDALRDKSEIEEKLHRTPTGNPVYRYTVGDAGRKRLAEIETSLPKEWRHAIEAVVARYGKLDLPFLVEEAYAHARRRPELILPGPPGPS